MTSTLTSPHPGDWCGSVWIHPCRTTGTEQNRCDLLSCENAAHLLTRACLCTVHAYVFTDILYTYVSVATGQAERQSPDQYFQDRQQKTDMYQQIRIVTFKIFRYMCLQKDVLCTYIYTKQSINNSEYQQSDEVLINIRKDTNLSIIVIENFYLSMNNINLNTVL